MIGKKRGHTIVAQVRIDGYSIAAIDIKDCGSIVSCCIAQISSFGINDNGHFRRDSTKYFLKNIHPFRTQYFKEG
jgi:hypothetical protein